MDGIPVKKALIGDEEETKRLSLIDQSKLIYSPIVCG
jgi:hypothetical protein